MPRPPEYCGSTAVMPNSGREVGDRPRARRRPTWRWYQRSAGQVRVEVGLGRVEPLRRSPRRRRARSSGPGRRRRGGATGSWLDGVPDLGVDGREDVLGLGVPGPPQVARQVGQRRRARRAGRDGRVNRRIARTKRTVAPNSESLRSRLSRTRHRERRAVVATRHRTPRTLARATRRPARVAAWSAASPSSTSCLSSISAGRRRRRPWASRCRSRRRCSARATTSSAPRSWRPTRAARGAPPVPMAKHPERPDFYEADGRPPTWRARGPSRCRPGPTRSAPGSTPPG